MVTMRAFAVLMLAMAVTLTTAADHSETNNTATDATSPYLPFPKWWLLLCLWSPICELFPNLYLSWWTPPNLKLTTYISLWPARVLSVLVVWLPLIFELSRITNPWQGALLIGAVILAAFALRLRLLGARLKAIVAMVAKKSGSQGIADKGEDELGVNAIAEAAVAPLSTVGDGDRDATLWQLLEEKPTKLDPLLIPEIMYFAIFASIAGLVYRAMPSAKWLALAGVGLIFMGAFGMATFRHRDLRKDVAGRVIFTTGFLINLYNFSRLKGSMPRSRS